MAPPPGGVAVYMGHMAVALGAKRARPEAPLAAFVVAAFAVDLVEITAGIAGVPPEPTTVTSVAVAAALALGLGLLWTIPYPSDPAGALLLGAVAISHVPLDAIDDRAALWPDGPVVGLGLHDRPWIEFPIEAAMVLVGWWLWRATLPPARREACLARALGPALVAIQAGFHARHLWIPGT